MKKRGVLTVVSGFSGAGKGTVMKALLEKYGSYRLSVSATTRTPREGEEEGISYFFKTKEEFQQMILEDAFIEYAQYVGNYYGTPKDYLLGQLEKGYDVILEIELQGALEVKKKLPETILVFVTPPTAAELKERLVGRGTETMEVILGRMNRAAEEAECMEAYDYILLNETGKYEECVDNLHYLIQTVKSESRRNLERINSIKEELKSMRKENMA